MGDEIVSIVGLDMTGGNTAQGSMLLCGPRGKVTLRLKRGVTIEISR